MVAILSDVTKFECLGPVNEFDNTAQNKIKLQRRLLQSDLPKTVYKVIRPTGSQRPRMYGLLKIHKRYVPCRPIFLMICPA